MTETSTDPRYQLESRIATGGMGEVWRATDTVLGREVALKILRPEYADDPSFRARFQQEARSAAALHHPNVASVFDFGELPPSDGSGVPRPYLVMELVPGEPLSKLLRGGEPMPPDTAVALIAQAADALAAAHARGIVHRDIKPGNVLVTSDRRVKITDFGIARAADASVVTQTGQVLDVLGVDDSVVIPAGLAILAIEFEFARRWLQHVRDMATAAVRKNGGRPPSDVGSKEP